MTVPRGMEAKLARLVQLVIEESARQNLISAASVAHIRERHIDDSLQLLPLCAPGPLLDIGSGAGFPGLVLACARDDATMLVEPRAKRATFLRDAALALDLPLVTVNACKVERVAAPPFATISARAVASLDRLFAMAGHLADPDTRWVLPKGRSAAAELAEARATWHGEFELIPSRGDPHAAIVVATGVRRRSRL